MRKIKPILNYNLLIPVAMWSKEWVCGPSLAEIAGSNPARDMDVSRECFLLSGRGLEVELVTRPEESYRVSECDREALIMRRL